MPKLTNILIGTGVGAAIAGVVVYATRMNRTSTQLESVVTAKIHSLKVDGLTIRVDARLKNPTNGRLRIKFPFVKLIYNNETIGTSSSVNQEIELPKFGEANIEAIMINIPVLGLLSLGKGLYEMLINNKEAELFVKTITTIDIGWRQLPYEKEDKIILKSPI